MIDIVELLVNAGFEDGWAVSGETLVLWEHDQDPPSPLTRPDAPVPDSISNAS